MWRKRYCAIVPKQQFYKTKISPFICACGITAWTSVTVPAVPQRLDRQIAKNLRGRATAWPPRKFTHHHSDRRFCSGTPGISCGATFCDTGNGNHLKLPLSQIYLGACDTVRTWELPRRSFPFSPTSSKLLERRLQRQLASVVWSLLFLFSRQGQQTFALRRTIIPKPKISVMIVVM